MSIEGTACWYRKPCKGRTSPRELTGWIAGQLVQFAQDHVEYETGPGMIPVAIIIDDKTRGVVVVAAENVTFAAVPPPIQ
jgi:hypothetical protein